MYFFVFYFISNYNSFYLFISKMRFPYVLSQITKIAIFGLTCEDKRTRDFVMVGPIFKKFLSKVAQDSKEKSHKISVQDFLALKNYREKCRGGGFSSPPPPPPGLNRVKGDFLLKSYKIQLCDSSLPSQR